MNNTSTIISIDQGTTSSRAILFDTLGNILFSAQNEFPQYYPQEGWVEHNPEEIWSTTADAVSQVVAYAKDKGYEVLGAGITNQRETTVIWDRKTGKAIYNAIVWQDGRTASECEKLKTTYAEKSLTQKTGLLLDPYFSATKIAWILDHVDGARARAEKGELAFGTIDSFLIWRLTQGESHTTDITNASRTNIFNIHTQTWDDELLTLFRVPKNILPQVLDCDGDFGRTSESAIGINIPIAGVAGDQQAAAIGQCCFDIGDIKSTYGTGCFVLMNTGEECLFSENRLLTTIASRINGKTQYAFEGCIFVAGAAVQWLRDGISLLDDARKTEQMAIDSDEDQDVYLVPAFTGLGAPHWNPSARGAMLGLTRNTGPNEIARATLESSSFQTMELLNAMAGDGVVPKAIKIDGGMVNNNWFAQNLANIVNVPIERPVVTETTALGVAYLVLLNLKLVKNLDDLKAQWQCERTFTPSLDAERLKSKVSKWKKAVECVQLFSEN